MGKVEISPNIRKTSDRIDPAGNIINARTKQIIKPVESEYIAPLPQPAPEEKWNPGTAQEMMSNEPKITNKVIDDSMSVLEQIAQTKKRLSELEELKKLKIAEKKAELKLLEL